MREHHTGAPRRMCVPRGMYPMQDPARRSRKATGKRREGGKMKEKAGKEGGLSMLTETDLAHLRRCV